MSEREREKIILDDDEIQHFQDVKFQKKFNDLTADFSLEHNGTRIGVILQCLKWF